MPLSGTALKGWIEIFKRSPSTYQNALDIFTEAIEKNGADLELLLGKCEASLKLKKYTVTVDTVNQIIVDFQDFSPAYEIKASVNRFRVK